MKGFPAATKNYNYDKMSKMSDQGNNSIDEIKVNINKPGDLTVLDYFSQCWPVCCGMLKKQGHAMACPLCAA
jgi:hypothetical protein